MIIKKNRAVSRLPASAVLNCDDRKKFAAFVGLLVQINKRINPSTQELRRTRPEEYTAPTRTRSKKTKKIDLGKPCREGSQKCGPLLFLITHTLSLLLHINISALVKQMIDTVVLLLNQDSFPLRLAVDTGYTSNLQMVDSQRKIACTFN